MKTQEERIRWFQDARFGMFIHWGLYSIPARGEWIKAVEKMDNAAYEKYFREFNPALYNPRKWAEIAVNAGMKYVVLTTKHHEGFCLFDSLYTEYKATCTPAGRDLVREYAEAFRAAGLKVGFYYSLIDWHHEHYPSYGDRFHPMKDNETYKGREIDFSKYVEYLHNQVRELMTNYGPIDILWFDNSYDHMTGEAWRATELVQMVRSLQPDILIDNRLGGNIRSCNPEIYAGDFTSPEQIIPPKGFVDEQGNPVPWEACITMNNSWGYSAADKDYKSAELIVRALVECVSKNGNFILNVGPDARGVIPEECEKILSEVGSWLSRNGESIYGCGAAGVDKQEWGRFTRRGNKLYAHIFERGAGPIHLLGFKNRILKARMVSDGSEVDIKDPWMAYEYPEDAFINLSSWQLPDRLDTVVELELMEE